MYQIEAKDFGFKLTFGGSIPKPEMQKWADDAKVALRSKTGSFGVMVDMRTLKPLAEDVQAVMVQGQGQFKTAGMVRSVVIVQLATVAMQFKRLARESGIYQWERYLSADDVPNWETAAKKWLVDGVDPDK
jgi:hypothetical protein